VSARGHGALPAPEPIDMEAHMPGRVADTITLLGHETARRVLACCRIRLAFLCPHGTPPAAIFALFSTCPFLFNHNREIRKGWRMGEQEGWGRVHGGRGGRRW
jgi:hypothetical protein